MDHLPFPEGTEDRHILVPHLGLAHYDGQGFVGYLNRIGLDEAKVLDNDLGEHDRTWVESCLQEWLFFGLLDEFFEICSSDRRIRQEPPSVMDGLVVALGKLWNWERLDPTKSEKPSFEGFVRIVDGCAVLTTSKLPGIISTAIKSKAQSFMSNTEIAKAEATAYPLRSYIGYTRLRGFDDLSCPQESLDRWQETLKAAWNFLAAMYSRYPDSVDCPMRPEILIACAILLESFSEASLYLFFLVENSNHETLFPGEFNKFLAKLWSDRGICPCRVARIDLFNASLMYFTARLSIPDSGDHSSCIGVWAGGCKAVPIALERMTAKHDSLCTMQNCPSYLVDDSEVRGILASGSFPVIVRSKGSSDGTFDYSIKDVLSSGPYVAISHVWSHGLGNPEQCSLPLCQIDKLFSLIEQLEPNRPCPALWIDTLCIPASGPLKVLGISRLKTIYTIASSVLVLDKFLMQVGDNIYLRRLELSHSEWLKRLWTFQEGWLNKNLYIQYKDCAIPLKKLLLGRYDVLDELFGKGSFGEDGAILVYANLLERPEPWHCLDTPSLEKAKMVIPSGQVSPANPFSLVVYSLQRRATTVAEDEPICLATLAGLDIDASGELPTMKDILVHVSKSHNGLPQHVLWDSGARIQEIGFRWAPASFLQRPHWYLGSFSEKAEITSEGILVECESFRLLSGIHWERDMSRDEGQYHGSYELRDSDGCVKRWFTPAFHFSPSPDQLKARMVRNPAILLEYFAGSEDERTGRAILVSGVEERDGILHGKYEVSIRTRKDLEKIESLNLGYPPKCIDCIELTRRKWCVD